MLLKCRGTLGDSYIANCVIHQAATQGQVHIKQCHTFWGEPTDDWEQPIRDIYSLLPNITVEFVGREEFESLEVPRLWPSIDKAREVNICPMNPHPRFVFPPSSRELPEKYVAFSPRGGKSTEDHRQIGFEEVDRLLRDFPNVTFVMVGHNPEFEDYGRANLINLIGQTPILEAMGIVARANRFIGIQGLMAYVALSQKVPSVVYTKSAGYDKAFRVRLMPEWLQACLIYKTYFTENARAFHKFMRRA